MVKFLDKGFMLCELGGAELIMKGSCGGNFPALEIGIYSKKNIKLNFSCYIIVYTYTNRYSTNMFM